MSDEILNKLKTFISNQGFGYTLPFPFLFKKKEITRETAIEKDLKITGWLGRKLRLYQEELY